MPETCWGPLCEWIHIFVQWLKIHVIPLAPLVAMLAGAIAFYSIHVTRVTARRRAAIDFFLKTDMDKGMAEIYKAFRDSLAVWEAHVAAKKPVEDFIKGSNGKLSDDYRNINTYLSIHELVAVGIGNKVFDDAVCYNFWSDALVRHTERTKALIEHEASTEGGAAAYWELRNLSSKWKKRLVKWQTKQTKKATR